MKCAQEAQGDYYTTMNMTALPDQTPNMDASQTRHETAFIKLKTERNSGTFLGSRVPGVQGIPGRGGQFSGQGAPGGRGRMGRGTLGVLLLRLSGERVGLSLCFIMIYTLHTCFCVYQLHNTV